MAAADGSPPLPDAKTVAVGPSADLVGAHSVQTAATERAGLADAPTFRAGPADDPHGARTARIEAPGATLPETGAAPGTRLTGPGALAQRYELLGEVGRGGMGVNGIDQSVWDPRTDTHIAAQYGDADLAGKEACKADLQRRFGLPENRFVPLIALAGRMVTQKGLDLVVRNHGLFQGASQFVFLGSGEKQFEDALHALHRAMPHRIGVETKFSDPLEHALMAGADLFLMPSQYEPCGLTQMRAQRYGTIPVARRVGGLADTIDDGVSGFLFDAFDERALAGGMWRALTEHAAPRAWREMQHEAMQRDFGWEGVAEAYDHIYEMAIDWRARARRG